MIVETVVPQTAVSPWRYSFQSLGGLKGKVSVKVEDAQGITHVADWTETWNPDEGLLLEIAVTLREEWAYPAKVMVDWAGRPVGGEEKNA